MTHLYPLRWNVTADGSGPGGSMRELRLSPDDTTLGWSHLSFKPTGVEQFSFVGHLRFNESPDQRDTAGPSLRARRHDPAVHHRPVRRPVPRRPKRPGEVMFNPCRGTWASCAGSRATAKRSSASTTRRGEPRRRLRHGSRTGEMRRATTPSTPTRSSHPPTTSGSSTSTSTSQVDRCSLRPWTACRRSTTWSRWPRLRVPQQPEPSLLPADARRPMGPARLLHRPADQRRWQHQRRRHQRPQLERPRRSDLVARRHEGRLLAGARHRTVLRRHQPAAVSRLDRARRPTHPADDRRPH